MENVYCGLGTAGSTTTTVVVRKNGVIIATMNILAGFQYSAVITSVRFTPQSDYGEAEITVAGTAARNLSVFGLFNR